MELDDCRECPVKRAGDNYMSEELAAINTQMVAQAATSGEIKGMVAGVRDEVVRRFEKLNGRVGDGEKNHKELCGKVEELEKSIAIMAARKDAHAQWIRVLQPVIWVVVTWFVLMIFRNADLFTKSMGHPEVPKIEDKR